MQVLNDPFSGAGMSFSYLFRYAEFGTPASGVGRLLLLAGGDDFVVDGAEW